MRKNINQKIDHRGKLAQIFDMGVAGEVLYSSILPGQLRGNHYHKQKKEQLCVVEGLGKFRLRNVKTGETVEYDVSGDNLDVIEILPWWTHHIENVGTTELKFVEWGDKPYDSERPDSFSADVIVKAASA